MKKILIILLIVIMLCGCNSNTESSKDDYAISIYTDSETCVEYLKYHSGYKGGITERYNKNGTLKINKKCLESKGE